MSKSDLIYVVDDDKDICDLVCEELEYYGFDIRAFHTGAQALLAIKRQVPKLCIVDLGLPDMDGLALVKALCDSDNVGVLILSGRGSLPDRVLGLELGADDYITKPFEPRELVARVHSLLRRINKDKDEVATHYCAAKKVRFADWIFNPSSLVLKKDSGEELTLSTAEADLLITLLRAPQQILSRDRLLGEQAIPYDRSIDSRMSRLRKKLETDPKDPRIIKTVYGAGYILSTPVEWISAEE
ncbi:response regulator transcription factor [Marinobacterium jannaschii]|uniref:response regulator transcription factor n=1 Tax=Marinobacterium jannaschii TaxID=64970 RepID=UPI0004899492|nr:response regulator transcription factor [Marinobacterium jannaschii]